MSEGAEMRSAVRVAIVAAMAAVLLAGAGCRRVPREHVDGERVGYRGSRDATTSIALEGATRLDALIAIGVGKLRLRAAEDTAAIATAFEYSSENWRPEVDYRVADGTGRLSVSQPRIRRWGGQLSLREMRYSWDIGLPPGVPTDLEIDLGAGESELALGGLDLESLRVDVGVGETRIDLSGTWSHDLDAEIDAGVGELTLLVPREAGVRVTGLHDGLGDFQADGMRTDGDAFVNDAWDRPGVPRLDIDLNRGVGKVCVVLAD